MNVILENFEETQSALSIDECGRIEIGTEHKDYAMSRNGAGQILLTPIAPPNEEHWIWRNPEALAMLDRGIAQAKAGMGRILEPIEDPGEID